MMILVTGGSGSGKSSFAEDCIVSFGNARRIYIATMYPFDEESKKRVKRHQAMRQGKGFDTLECYTGLVRAAIPEGSTVLLECMSNLVANEMFQENGAHENTVEAVIGGVEFLQKQTQNLVIVTNEIFSETEAELYCDVKISDLAAALTEGSIDLLKVSERDEDLEGYFINLVGGAK